MILLDSHGTNEFATTLFADTINKVGQSIRLTHSARLMEARLQLTKTGSPTGDVTVSLFAHAGVFGDAGSLPIGSALATSSAIDASTLTGGYAEYVFEFSSPYLLYSNAPIWLALEYNNGDVSNRISTYINTSDLSHPGVYAHFSSGAWTTSTTRDLTFELYGEYVKPTIQGVQSMTGVQSIQF